MKSGSDGEIDADLARRCLDGDGDAVRAFVSRHQGRIFAMCFRMLGHREDAEDVAQEVFLRVFRSLTQWDQARPIRPWMTTIAVNCCRTFVDRRSRRPIAAEFVEAVATDESVTPNPELGEELQLALEALRNEYREVFVLFYQQELSVQEISDALGMPQGTVKTWLHRARKEMVEQLRRRGIDPQFPGGEDSQVQDAVPMPQ